MSSAAVEGPPEAKRFRIDVPTQVVVDTPSVSTCSAATPVAGEASLEGQSPAAPSSASYRSSNGSVVYSSDSPSKDEENEGNDDLPEGGGACDILEMISKSMLSDVFGKMDENLTRPTKLLSSLPTSPSPQMPQIPGAMAVAQSPAAQLFAEDDWSWHRNPAAAIRSGGTNKQTPVWKYFVYNKAENVSRCIIGDCTYMLKGPHTSTLACHLKKHTKEYQEFQKLKAEYSRTKMEVQSQPKEMTNRQSPGASPIDIMNVKQSRPKKETPSKISDVNLLVSALRAGSNATNGTTPTSQQNNLSNVPSTPTSQLNSMPALMQNMMMSMNGMNPLQMMLAHTLPTSSANFSAAAALQQAGLSLAPNGQIVPSKKWRKDERKQKDIETKLALAMATSHVPVEALQNPIWKDLFELAQPKFNMSIENGCFEQIVNSTHVRLHQSIKTLLSNARKVNILVDTVKISGDISRVTVSVAIPPNSGAYETQVILLALKNLPQSDNVAEEISKIIEQVITDFGISNDVIKRIVCSGIRSIVGEDCGNIVDKQMESFASRLLSCLNFWLENSQFVDSLRKAVFTMIFSVITNPSALQLATKINGGKFDLPITETFPVLIEALVQMKDCLQLNHVEGFMPISESKWSKLQALNSICAFLKPYLGYGSDVSTVDNAIPTIQQILHALDKDIYHMGDMAAELREIIAEKLSYVTDPEHEDFDPTFVQATAVSPQLAISLNPDQMATAKKLIEQEVSRRSKKAQQQKSDKKLSIGVDSILANVMKGATEGRDAMSIYGNLFPHVQKDDRNDAKEDAVGKYFEEISRTNTIESLFNPIARAFGTSVLQAPLSYWKSCSHKCPELAELAQELLSIPLSTVSTERALSFSPTPSPFALPNSNLILSHLDNPDAFEKQVLLRFNRSLVAKIF